MSHEWQSILDWRPHERGLARWAAQKWGWKQGDEDWPSSLALLVAAEDEGHTALNWNLALELASRRFQATAASPPRLPPPDVWPQELFSEGWLVRRLAPGIDLVQTRRNALLEKKLFQGLLGLKFSRDRADSPFLPDAVSRAGQTQLLILVGGPGTGKTSTVKKLTQAWNQAQPGLRVVVAAPTGRAAARARESFGDLASAPECLTLHRLLGLRPGMGTAWHGPHRPLPFDLVIVDEASMLDLRTAAALVDSLAPRTALVLVGDPGQLPSVDAGNVLADLLARPEFEPSVVRLTTRHRLDLDSRCLAEVFDLLQDPLSQAEALVDKLAALGGGQHPDFVWHQTSDGEDPGPKALEVWGSAHTMTLGDLSQRVLLSPVHEGPGGTETLAALVDRGLRRPPGSIEAGMPWMITRNLPHLDLHNGDRGLITRRGQDLWFTVPGTPLREWPFALVGEDGQQAWAVTVHKSQGSEFNRVVLVLPPGEAPGLVRELVYTGLTRAKTGATLVASRASLLRALGRSARRDSGFGLPGGPEI